MTPRVGGKDFGHWLQKNNCSAQNGRASTVPQVQAMKPAVQRAQAIVSGAKTPPIDVASKHDRARISQKRELGRKSNAARSLVHRAVVADIQKLQGEKDALLDVVRCTLEEAAEPASPRCGDDVFDETVVAGAGREEESPLEKLPQFEVPAGMSRALYTKIEQDLVGFEFVEKGVDIKPMLVKRLYEKYCVATLVSNPTGVVIIGRERFTGCYLRHHVRSSDDVGVEADCACEPGQECTGCGCATKYVLVDVVDRFSPRDVALLLSSDPAPEVYSVQYEYREARGGHHVVPGGLPEVRWERSYEGLWVEDDLHVGRYVKNPADWTRTGATLVDGLTLCWNVNSKIGDCRVVRYYLVDTVVAPVIDKDPCNDSYYGDTTPDQAGLGDPRATELQVLIGPITKMYSAGDMFYCSVDAQQILVPKQGVGHIALWAAGKPREQRTYSDAYIQARQWLKTTRLTTLERADCIPYMVAFGLLRTVNTEARAIGCLGSHARDIALHNELVSNPFAAPLSEFVRGWMNWFVDNKRWLAPVLGSGMALITTVAGVWNKGKIIHMLLAWHQLWTKVQATRLATGTSPVLYVLFWAIDAIYRYWIGMKRKPRVASPLLTYCARGRELKDMREDARCRIRHVDIAPQAENCDDVDCLQTEGPFHIGLGVAGHIPVVARHCVHNDLVAVRNRGICDRAPPARGWWYFVGKTRMFRLFGGLGPIIATARLVWLSRYTGARIRELERAEADDDEYHPYEAVRRKAFTKSECAEKRTDPTDEEPFGAIEGYDPRLIQGCLPEYVNDTGPFAHAFSKACKGEHGDTTYGPGLNALQLDGWLEMAEASFDEPVAFIDSDAVRLDASVCVDCISVEADLYEHLGADEAAMEMFRADAVTHGATSNGIVYRVDGTVPSGKTTTTCGNTVAVIVVVEEALESVPHKAIVAGDDAAILVPLRLVKQAQALLVSTGRSAGFEFKVKASRTRWDMEFCSGRWWPAAVPTGFAFGPKPGKLLPKLFYATSKNAVGGRTYGYCHAICIGMLDTINHLPVAREFVEQVLLLTRDYPQHMTMMKKIQDIGHVRRKRAVQQSPEVWEAYAQIYGVSQVDCQSAIRDIRAIESLPDLVEHHVFDMMVAQDAPAVGDPDLRDPELLGQGNLWKAFEKIWRKWRVSDMYKYWYFNEIWNCAWASQPWQVACGNLATGVDWWASWVTPFFEEWLKKTRPTLTAASLITVEGCVWVARGYPLSGYVPAALMHVATAVMQARGHFWKAVFLHYLFNVAVTFWNRRRRLATGSLIDTTVASFQVISRPRVLPESSIMNYVALPQRQRKQRERKNRKRNGGAPPLPPRNTYAYTRSVVRLPGVAVRTGRPRTGRRRAQRRRLGDGFEPDFAGTRNVPGMPDGMRRGRKRHNFDEDEFIVDLLGNTTFGNGANLVAQQFAVNPGQAVTFPWLSAIAPKFEKYVFTKLEFYYKHEVSQFATAGTTGKAILSFDYDAADAPPISKQQMLDTDPHMDKMPCQDFVLAIDCREAFNNGPKYVRPGNVPGGSDIKMYDCGLLNYGASGTVDATTKIGELHVRYTGWFEKPVLESTTSAPANNQVSWFQSTAAQTYVTTVNTTALNATATANGLNIVNTAGSMVPPAGNYIVDFTCVAQDSAGEALSVLADFFKNGATVYATGPNVPFFVSGVSLGALETDALAGSVFVSANGTDAFTQKVRMIGAAGTLTAGTAVRWTAV